MSTVATSTLLGRPVWYELMTTNTEAAETFYKNGGRLDVGAIHGLAAALHCLQAER